MLSVKTRRVPPHFAGIVLSMVVMARAVTVVVKQKHAMPIALSVFAAMVI